LDFPGHGLPGAGGSSQNPDFAHFPPTRQLILFPKKNKMNYLFANNQAAAEPALIYSAPREAHPAT
jgi:hypothetical protein